MRQKFNKVIRNIQDKLKCSRTDAMKDIVKNYDISYATILAMAKYGRSPKQKRLWLVIEKICNDYEV